LLTCRICNNIFQDRTRFVNHLRKHGIRSKLDLKKYYDIYIKKQDEEGICKLEECNNFCKFKGITLGYSEGCCRSHRTKLQMKKHNHMIGKPPSKKRILRYENNKKIREDKRINDLKNRDKIIDDALNGIFNFDIHLDILKTCVFCEFKVNNIVYKNASVCFHVFKKHNLDANSYKELFLYKRRRLVNLCIGCGSKISSSNKYNVCVKCISIAKKLVWSNFSIEEKNSIIKKISIKNTGKKHPHSEQTIEKIKLNSAYNDPIKSSILKAEQSKIMTEKILNHKFNPHSSYKNGYVLLKKCDKEIFYRSSNEKIILENLDNLDWGDKIVYEPLRCKYLVIEKGISYYRYTIPDLLLEKNSYTFLSEMKPFEFLESPIDCWDKFLIEKLKSIIKYSFKNNLRNPIILTIKNQELYLIDMINYIEEISKNGFTTIEELFSENNENKKYKINRG